MRGENSSHPPRYFGEGAKRRAPLVPTAGAAAALGALAGCGSDDGGGGGTGTGTGGDTGSFAEGAFTGTTGDNAINEVSRGATLLTVDAGEGNDSVNTGVGTQTITGGTGDDTIDGGDGVDTAVFAGAVAGYHVNATLDGGRVSLTIDDSDAAAFGDDGTDTLNNIEVLRFGADEFVVATHAAADRDRGNSEIILGDAGPNGDGSVAVDGGGGDDLIFGFAGDDVLVGGGGDDRIFGGNDNDTLNGGAGDDIMDGGAGDDIIDGGEGMDTVVYSGARANYRIWRIEGSGGDPDRIIALHRSNAAGNEGRDTLTNVEIIQFGGADAVALNADFEFDVAGIAVAGGAPGAGAELEAGDAITAIDVSEWFDSADVATVTYSVVGDLPEGVTLEGNMLGGVAPMETATITIVASDVPNETHDDISHEYVINVAAAAPGTLDAMDNIHVDPNTSGMEDAVIAGLAGDDVITGGIGNDTIHGNSTTSLGEAGESDTAVYEGALDGYAISVELHTFNPGASEMTNVPRITVRDIATGDGAVDEGTDMLVGFEVIRFGNATSGDSDDDVDLMVVRGNTDRTPTADVDEIVIGAATADGTNASTALMGGVGDDFMFGLGGDDFLSGGEGDDTISGGAGDDTIDGGADMDTAVYAGTRADFRIWFAGTGADRLFHIQDKDPATNGDDGRDTLSNVEMVRFGDSSAVALNAALAGDGAPLTVTSGAPPTRTEGPVEAGSEVTINAAPWFQSAMNATVTYVVGVTMGAGTVTGAAIIDMDSGVITFTAPGDEGMYTITVTASDDSGDYDDVPHSHVVTVVAAANDVFTGTAGNDVIEEVSRGADLITVDAGAGDDTVATGAGAQTITGGAGDDTIDGGAGVDIAVFAGSRNDYRIWRPMEGSGQAAVTRTIVLHKFNSDSTGDDDGRDTLTNIETLRFGTTDMSLAGFEFDEPRLEVATGAPDSRTEPVDVGSSTMINASGWFSAMGDDVTYMATASTGTVIIADDGMITFTAPNSAGTVTLTVTASDDTGDYDDASRTYEITVVEQSRVPSPRNDLLERDGESGELLGMAGSDTFTGGSGDDMFWGNTKDAVGATDETDRAVYFGEIGHYDITAALVDVGGTMVVQLTVEDVERTLPAGASAMDEGTDTLTDFDEIRFDGGGAIVTLAIGTIGTATAEILVGDAMANGSLSGLGGDDIIFGFAMDDVITGGEGDDRIDGGTGSDTAVFAGVVDAYSISATRDGSNVEFTVDDIDATAGGDDGTDTLTGFEALGFVGGSMMVTLMVVETGTPDPEILLGGDTADTALTGLGGDDIIFGFAEDDVITGGEGDDRIDGGMGEDVSVFAGGLSGYRISAASRGDEFEITVEDTATTDPGAVDEGMDTLFDMETLRFSSGDLLVVGHGRAGRTLSDDVDEIVVGQAGPDGTDLATGLVGGSGDDFVFGLGGDDFLSGGIGDDVIDGGDDEDTAVFQGALAGFHIMATLSGANATIMVEDTATTGGGEIDEGTDTLMNVETIRFGSSSLTVVALASSTASDSEIILGTDGMDGSTRRAFNGGAEVDVIFGFGGGDFLSGGAGDDRIDGGAGDDTAVFEGALAGYDISASLSDDNVKITVTDTATTGFGAVDEGADDLTNIETLQFAGATLSVVNHDATRTPTDDVDEIVLGRDIADGSGTDVDPALGGGAGDDWVFGFADDDFLRGGLGDDLIDGGAGDDTAVFEGVSTGYSVSVELSGTDPRIIVRDTHVTDIVNLEEVATVDEGTDTLVGIETVRFGTADVVVVMHGATRTLTNDVDEIVVGREGEDGTDASTGLMGGVGDDHIFGLGGDDFLIGGAGADIITGGAGDDEIFGHEADNNGSDTDRAVYAGGIRDYMFMPDPEDLERLVVVDADAVDGTDEGRDTLASVETLRFDGGVEIEVANIRFGAGNSGVVAGAASGRSVIYGEGGGYDLTGGGGADIFQFLSAADGPDDAGTTVTGFDAASGDRIALADVEGLRNLFLESAEDGEGNAVVRLSGMDGNFVLDIAVVGEIELGDVRDSIYSIGATSGAPPSGITLRGGPEASGTPLADRTVSTGTEILPIIARATFAYPYGEDSELTYTATVGENGADLSTIGLSLDDGEITGTIETPGTHSITVTAANARGDTFPQSFVITAAAPTPGNQSPVLVTPLADRFASEGAETMFDVRPSFNDPDNDALTYEAYWGFIDDVETTEDLTSFSPSGNRINVPDLISLTELDRGINIDRNTGIISGELTTAGIQREIILVVRDPDGGVATVDGEVLPSFLLDSNRAPVLTRTPPRHVIAERGTVIEPIDLGAGFEDPEGDAISFTVGEGTYPLPDGLRFDEETNVISGTFNGSQQRGIRIDVVDERGARFMAINEFGRPGPFILEFHEPAPPVAVQGSVRDQTIVRGEAIAPIDLSNGFYEANEDAGDVLTYTATVGEAGADLSTIGLWIVRDEIRGTYNGALTSIDVTVTATDLAGLTSVARGGGGMPGSITFTITVNSPNPSSQARHDGQDLSGDDREEHIGHPGGDVPKNVETAGDSASTEDSDDNGAGEIRLESNVDMPRIANFAVDEDVDGAIFDITDGETPVGTVDGATTFDAGRGEIVPEWAAAPTDAGGDYILSFSN